MSDVHHVIKTHGVPVRSEVRRLSPEMLEIAKKVIDRLLEAQIIQRETVLGFCRFILCKKQPGQCRLTVDFRASHAVTEHNPHSLTYLSDFTNSLHGCKIFSLIDLKKAFHQVPTHPNSVAKICTVTPFGFFLSNYLQFGLSNSAQCLESRDSSSTSLQI